MMNSSPAPRPRRSGRPKEFARRAAVTDHDVADLVAVRVVDITQQIDVPTMGPTAVHRDPTPGGVRSMIGHRSPRRQTRRLVVLECELRVLLRTRTRVIDIAEVATLWLSPHPMRRNAG